MHWFDRKRRWTLGVCVAAGVFLASVAAVQADIWVYQYQDGAYKQVGKVPSSGGHVSVVCASAGGQDCIDLDCVACHMSGSATSELQARGFDEGRHWREYFPRRTVQLAPGQSVPWSNQRLELRSGAIAIIDARGEPVIRFPTDTILLRDRSGRPALLVSRGDRPLTR